METTKLKLASPNQNDFEFGKIIEDTFENFKKIVLLQGLVFLLVVVLFSIVIGSIAGLAFGIGALTEYFTDLQINGISELELIIRYGTNVIGAGISAPFTAGMLKMCSDAYFGQEVKFSTAFEYYRSTYFKNLFVTGIIISAVVSGITTVFALLTEHYLSGALKSFLVFFSFIFNIVAYILTVFAIPLVVFGNLDPKNAIHTSIDVAKQKFWTIFVLLLVIGVCTLLGFFAFCIGIVFTLTLVNSLIFTMYNTAIGVEEVSEINDIGKIEL
jgi:hypothetical protein